MFCQLITQLTTTCNWHTSIIKHFGSCMGYKISRKTMVQGRGGGVGQRVRGQLLP